MLIVSDTSKSSTFSGTASGVVLPVFVIYKADHLYDSRTLDGPKGDRYNRFKSGWFDTTLFEDWFFLWYFLTIEDSKIKKSHDR